MIFLFYPNYLTFGVKTIRNKTFYSTILLFFLSIPYFTIVFVLVLYNRHSNNSIKVYDLDRI